MVRMRREGHLTEKDVLELGYASMIDVPRLDPDLIDRLTERLDRAMGDTAELDDLPDDQARLVAHLAFLGLGELLIRAAGKVGR